MNHDIKIKTMRVLLGMATLFAVASPALGETITLVCTNPAGVNSIYTIDFDKRTVSTRNSNTCQVTNHDIPALITDGTIQFTIHRDQACNGVLSPNDTIQITIDRTTGQSTQTQMEGNTQVFEPYTEPCHKQEKQF